MLVKGVQMEPLVHMVIILAFLVVRVPKWRRSVQASLRGLPDKVLRR